MTALTLKKLLGLTIAQLEELRQRYHALSTATADSRLAMFTGFLASREAGTIAALTRYIEHDEEDDQALDVHVRLAWGFPFTDKLEWPADPQIDNLIELAEHSDEMLAALRERVELYAAGFELHESLDALDAIVMTRRQELASAARELEEATADPAPAPSVPRPIVLGASRSDTPPATAAQPRPQEKETP